MALSGGFTKLRKATISFIMSVRPSVCQCAWNSSSPHWMDLREKFILETFIKFGRWKSKFG